MRGNSLVVVRGRDWRSAHCTGGDDSRGACGNVSVEMVARAGCFSTDDELREGHSDVLLDRGRFFCYVDNIGILGLTPDGVREAMAKVILTLEAHGLVTHDFVDACVVQEILGIELDGEKHRTRITPKRYSRLRKVLRWVLGRRKISGAMLEIIMGHITYSAMCYRPSLSIFSTVYKFIRAHHDHQAKIWKSVRAELQSFLGIMPLLQHSWHAQWSDQVLCTDACLGGYGAVMGDMSTAEVRALGSERERRRFKFKSVGGRARALRQDPWASPTADPDSDLDEWEVDHTFPEVDPAALLRVDWRVVCHGAYEHSEPIHILEARAQHSGLLEAHVQSNWYGMRTLTLMDNMSDVLALERARAQNYGLLLQLRRSAAMSMVFHIRQSFRWLPSEHNPSDAPSRLYENDKDALHAGTDKIQFSYSNFGPAMRGAREPLDVASFCASEELAEATADLATESGDSEGEGSAAHGPDVFDIGSADGEDALSSGSFEDGRWPGQGGEGDLELIHPGLRAMFRDAAERPSYPESGSHKRQEEIQQGSRGHQRHIFRGGRSRRRLQWERRWRTDEVTDADLRQTPARAGALLRPGSGWLIFGRGRPQLPRAVGGPVGLAGCLRGGDGAVSQLESPAECGVGDGCGGRGDSRPLDESSFLRRSPLESWRKICSVFFALPPGLREEGPALNREDVESPERLEEACASAQQEAEVLAGGRRRGHVPDRAWRVHEGSVDVDGFRRLPSAFRFDEASTSGCGAPGRLFEQSMVPRPQLGRLRGGEQDRCERRVDGVGQCRDEVLGWRGLCVNQGAGAAVVEDLGFRLPGHGAEFQGRQRGFGLDAVRPVPVEALGSKLGQASFTPLSDLCDETGTLEKPVIARPLREGRHGDQAVREAARKVEGASTHVRGSDRARDKRPARSGALPLTSAVPSASRPSDLQAGGGTCQVGATLRMPPAKNDVHDKNDNCQFFDIAAPADRKSRRARAGGRKKLVLDLFAGVGRVARAVRRGGDSCEEIDIVHGKDHDVTDKKICERLCRRIRRGEFDASMIGAPCTSFTVARDRTCIIRTKNEPWGLEDRSKFSANDMAALELGNRITRSLLKIMNALVQSGTAFVLENPRSSRIWHLPELVRIANCKRSRFVYSDYCQFGTAWRKRTGFLCFNCDEKLLDQLASHKCTGSCGRCSRTGTRHTLLTGSAPGGIPMTLLAQPYPPKLANLLGKILTTGRIDED